jgi:hypothetical protein
MLVMPSSLVFLWAYGETSATKIYRRDFAVSKTRGSLYWLLTSAASRDEYGWGQDTFDFFRVQLQFGVITNLSDRFYF